jgi:glutamine amidotransferase
MFGFIGNRSDLGARVLELNASVLRVQRAPEIAQGWGIGFYQSGEALLRRRPVDERDVIDLTEAAEAIRTDVMVGHVRRPGVGALRTENTHPFRYRMWLFAQTGTILGFDGLRDRLWESQPEFLRRNVRGDTDSELFFYLFLSFLHGAGHLSDGDTSHAQVIEALRACVELVDRLSAEEGHPKNGGNLLVTNGEHIVALHRDGLMAYRELTGHADPEDLLGEEGLRRVRVPSIDGTRFVLLASDMDEVPAGFTQVPAESFVTLERARKPAIAPL